MIPAEGVDGEGVGLEVFGDMIIALEDGGFVNCVEEEGIGVGLGDELGEDFIGEAFLDNEV